jgi:hypothetical protein
MTTTRPIFGRRSDTPSKYDIIGSRLNSGRIAIDIAGARKRSSVTDHIFDISPPPLY